MPGVGEPLPVGISQSETDKFIIGKWFESVESKCDKTKAAALVSRVAVMAERLGYIDRANVNAVQISQFLMTKEGKVCAGDRIRVSMTKASKVTLWTIAAPGGGAMKKRYNPDLCAPGGHGALCPWRKPGVPLPRSGKL